MNAASWIIVAVIALLVILAVRYIVRHGSSCSECGGGCSACGGNCSSCHYYAEETGQKTTERKA